MPRLMLPADASPTRLDKLLCEKLPGCSRRLAKELIAAGHVRVDGRRTRKGQEIPPGAIVDVDPDYEAQLQPNEKLSVAILYEDSSVVAVDKPAGMPTHAVRADETETVANFLLARYPEVSGLGGALEPGVVHRLDNDTSGVLLAARTAVAHGELRRQFTAHQVVKKYLALVQGDVARAATIDAPIEHIRGKARRMRTAAPGNGREAVTHILPLRRFTSHTLVEIEMRTGVRHQIRVHLTAIGHPIEGDSVYGSQTDAATGRHLLHASSIEFVHPQSGEKVIVRSELPEDFRARLASL